MFLCSECGTAEAANLLYKGNIIYPLCLSCLKQIQSEKEESNGKEAS